MSVTAAQSAFSNTLLKNIAIYDPTVDPAKLLATGATDLKNAFSSDQMVGVLKAYMDGLHNAFAIAIAEAGLATLISLVMRWKNLKGAKTTSAV